MKRRDFMRTLLGGGAAALVGATVPVDLSADELALLEERVTWSWKGSQIVITNHTQHSIEVRGEISSHAPQPGMFYRVSVGDEWTPMVAIGEVRIPKELQDQLAWAVPL